jgi:hypothetical protein
VVISQNYNPSIKVAISQNYNLSIKVVISQNYNPSIKGGYLPKLQPLNKRWLSPKNTTSQ